MPRPRSVTFVALLVLFLAVFNLWGAIEVLRRYTFLSQLPLSLPPAYLLVSRALWAAVFAVLGFGLWRLREWARVGTLVAFVLYVGQDWIERLWFVRTEYASTTLPFYLLLHGLVLLLLGVTLLPRRARRYFSA